MWRSPGPHQLLDLRLQVLYAVQLPLAAALGSDPVLAPSPNVMDAVQLFRRQLVHLQQGLEVVSREGDYSLCVKRQFHLECEMNISRRCYVSQLHLDLGRERHVFVSQRPSLGLRKQVVSIPNFYTIPYNKDW